MYKSKFFTTEHERYFIESSFVDNAISKIFKSITKAQNKTKLTIDANVKLLLMRYLYGFLQSIFSKECPVTFHEITKRTKCIMYRKKPISDLIMTYFETPRNKKILLSTNPDKLLTILQMIDERFSLEVSIFLSFSFDQIITYVLNLSIEYEIRMNPNLSELSYIAINHVIQLTGSFEAEENTPFKSIHLPSDKLYNSYVKELNIFIKDGIQTLASLISLYRQPLEQYLRDLKLSCQEAQMKTTNIPNKVLQTVILMVDRFFQTFDLISEVLDTLNVWRDILDFVIENKSEILGVKLADWTDKELFSVYSSYAQFILKISDMSWIYMLLYLPGVRNNLTMNFNRGLQEMIESEGENLNELLKKFTTAHFCNNCLGQKKENLEKPSSEKKMNILSGFSSLKNHNRRFSKKLSISEASTDDSGRVKDSYRYSIYTRSSSSESNNGTDRMSISQTSSKDIKINQASDTQNSEANSPSSNESGVATASEGGLFDLKKSFKYQDSSGSIGSPPSSFRINSSSPSSYSESLVSSMVTSQQFSTYSILDNKILPIFQLHSSQSSSSGQEFSNLSSELEGLVEAFSKINEGQDLVCALEEQLEPSCNMMIISIKYMLPRLLLLPIFHFLHIYDIIKEMHNKTCHSFEKLALSELLSSMSHIKKFFDDYSCKKTQTAHQQIRLLEDFYDSNFLLQVSPTLEFGIEHQLTPDERNDIIQVIRMVKVYIEDNDHLTWFSPPRESDYIMNGILHVGVRKISVPFNERIGNKSIAGKRTSVSQVLQYSYRHVFLFRNCLIICKRYIQCQKNVSWNSKFANTFPTIPLSYSPSSTSILNSNAGSLHEDQHSREESPSMSSFNVRDIKIKSIIPLRRFHVVDDRDVETDQSKYRFSMEYELASNDENEVIPFVMNSFYQSASLRDPSSDSLAKQSFLDNTDDKSINSSSTIQAISSIDSQITLVPTCNIDNYQKSTFDYSQPMHDRRSTCRSTARLSICSTSTFYTYKRSEKSGMDPKDRVYLKISFDFATYQEKSSWISMLSFLEFRKFMNKSTENNSYHKIPLILPASSNYRFTEPDSNWIIQYDTRTESNVGGYSIILDRDPAETYSEESCAPIKCATVVKMIEKLTHHVYFEKKAVKIFLQNYRRYLSSEELLNLIIERFNIPIPDFENIQMVLNKNKTLSEYYNIRQNNFFWEVDIPARLRERFIVSYKNNVQRNCLNFISKWIRDKVFFKLDFSKNANFRQCLGDFLDSIDNMNLITIILSIKRYMVSSMNDYENSKRPKFMEPPLEILDLCLISSPSDISLTNVHPVELARQITIHEWELYSKIEFWELNGKNYSNGPNLKNSSMFSNRLINWFIWSILSADSIEDRCIVMQRLCDLMIAFEKLNNLQGYQEAKSALISAPVFRLDDTQTQLMQRSRSHHREIFTKLFYEDAQGMNNPIYDSINQSILEYQRKVASIDPPGVPFVAISDLTRLIHIDVKFPDWIEPAEDILSEEDARESVKHQRMINFTKCIQISDLIDHFLLFQQVPYNIKQESNIKKFLEELDIQKQFNYKDQSDLEDAFHLRSLEIQPSLKDELHHLNLSVQRLPCRAKLTSCELRLANHLSINEPDINLSPSDKHFKILQTLASNTPGDSTFSLMRNPLTRFRKISFGSYTNTAQQMESAFAKGDEQEDRVGSLVAPPLPPKRKQSTDLVQQTSRLSLQNSSQFSIHVNMESAPLSEKLKLGKTTDSSSHVDSNKQAECTNRQSPQRAPPLPPKSSSFNQRI